jgi:PAS domain S-box-containing protein/diguanylate cyclase (GGDEF)-like protein
VRLVHALPRRAFNRLERRSERAGPAIKFSERQAEAGLGGALHGQPPERDRGQSIRRMKHSGRRRVARAQTTVQTGSAKGGRAGGDARTPAARPLRRVARPARLAPGRDALARALGSATAAVTLLDRDWRIVFINQRSAEMLGASRDALLGRRLWDLFPGASSGRAYHEFARALNDQVSVVFEQLSPNAGRTLHCLAVPSPEGLLVVSRDVAETAAPAEAGSVPVLAPSRGEQVVSALERSDRRFRALIENSLDAVLMVDARGRVLYASPRVFGREGLLARDAGARALLDLIHPDDAARARDDFVRVIATAGERVPSTYRVRGRHGWMWIEGVAHNLLHDPDVRAVVINCRDVTARRDAEDAYRSLVDHSFQAQLIAQDRSIVFANPTLAQMTGIDLDELHTLGFPELIEMVHPEDRTRVVEAFAARLAGRDTEQVFAFRYVRRDGAVRWIEGRGDAIDHRGAPAVQVALLDVTEQRRAEDDLRFSEQHFRSLIEGALDLVTVVDDWGKVLYASPSHERVLGWHPSELVGRQTLELVHPDDRARLASDFESAMAGHSASHLAESRIRHKDGSWRVLESITHRSPAASPVGGYIVNARDVTGRFAAEERTRTLLELARDLASALDAGELLQRVGRRVAAALPCELVAICAWNEELGGYGITAAHGISREAVAAIPAIPHTAARTFLERLAAGPVVFEAADAGTGLLGTVARRFGVRSVIAAPLRAASWQHGALIAATTRDGTRFGEPQSELLGAIAGQLAVGLERAELHRERADDARLFEALARVGQELLSSFDVADLPARLCKTAAAVLGTGWAHTLAWRPDERAYAVVAAQGAPPDVLEALRVVRIPRTVLEELLGGAQDDVVRVAVDGVSPGSSLATVLGVPRGTSLLAIALRRGGELVGLQTAVLGPGDGALGAVQRRIASGLAHLGSLALEHARAMDELDHANRLKSDFVAMISHELRTPLNVILGYSDLLLDDTFGALAPAQAEILRSIHARGRELLQLIRDVLDLSRLDSGRIPLDVKEVALDELLAEITQSVAPLARPGEVELVVRAEPALTRLRTDPAKLGVALKNLLANAFKFTALGSVALEVARDGDDVVFTVRDTGIGIPREQLDIIFEPFRQGDPALTRRHGGVGLGLYIVRRMVEVLGGSVRVESAPGEGSTFRIRLPGERPAAAASPKAVTPLAPAASTDAVTGLPSLRVFQDRLVAAMRASDPRRVAGAVLYVSIEGTGNLVPEAHDALLCMVGERLLSVVRMTDTVARHGGDDFVVLLPGRSTDDAIDELSRRVRAVLGVDLVVEGEPRRVHARVGATLARGGRATAEATIARARRAAR